MKLVPRAAIDIVSSNISIIEEGIDVWESNYPNGAATGYALNSIVQHGTDIFKSLIDNNTAVPVVETNLNWLYQGKTNYYRMFDADRNTVTSNEGSITYTFNINDVDTVAFFNVVAETINLVVKNQEGNEVYNKSADLITREVTNWLEWLTEPFETKNKYIAANLPLYYNATLTVTVSNSVPTKTVSCGHIVFGTSRDLGAVLFNPVASIRTNVNETIKNNNVVIENTLVRKRIYLSVLIDSTNVDRAYNLLEKYVTTPCLFVGDQKEGGYTVLSAFGYYKDFDMPISLNTTEYEIEILGVQ